MKEQSKFNFENIANIIVVLAIIVVTGVIVKKYFFNSNEPIQKIEIGQKIFIPEVDWNQNKKTIILAVTRNCPFCTASADFFRQIAYEAETQNIKFEVVTPESKEDIKSYLEDIDVPTQNVHYLPLRKYGFKATPMLLFVNEDGTLKDMWIGRVDAEDSKTVLNKLNSFTTPEVSENLITPTELKTLLENNQKVLLVDIDTREEFKDLHIVNAKNIPDDEIQTRAAREIPKDNQIVFYGRCPRDSGSSFSQKQLARLGYSNVSFLVGGLKGWKDVGYSVEKSTEISQNE